MTMQAMRHVGKLSYNPKDIIGSGTFGSVFKGFFEGTKSVAIKRVHRVYSDDESINKEAEITLKVSDHPNIIRYFCYEMTEDFLFIATELCVASLQDYVEGKYYEGTRFESEKKLLHQITKGLAHLHHMDVIHRDVKPTNILISLSNTVGLVKPQIKLADFGISNILRAGVGENEDSANPYGSRGWMAPEMYNSEYFDFKADIFPLGCVFGYTLTGGKHPFGDDPIERHDRIERGDGTTVLIADYLNTLQADNRSTAFELIESMLNRDPKDRPTAEEILNSPFFQKTVIKEPDIDLQLLAAALPSSSLIIRSNISGTLIRISKLSYNKEQEIYDGRNGIFVYQGLYEGLKPVAVKRFQRSSQIDELLVKREAELMLKANDHANILRYFCYEMDENFLFLATELCIGTLQQLIEGKLKELLGPSSSYLEDEKEILVQITKGLAHLHLQSIKIIHRDVKPTNFLVYQPAGNMKPLMKVADFGISKLIRPQQVDTSNTNMTNPKGTIGWMAPEQYNSDRLGREVDIFSLGCVFGYTLSEGNKHPFGEDIYDRIYLVKRRMPMILTNNDLKSRYLNDGGLAFQLIQSMLNMDPVKRPTAQSILENEFFNGYYTK